MSHLIPYKDSPSLTSEKTKETNLSDLNPEYNPARYDLIY